MRSSGQAVRGGAVQAPAGHPATKQGRGGQQLTFRYFEVLVEHWSYKLRPCFLPPQQIPYSLKFSHQNSILVSLKGVFRGTVCPSKLCLEVWRAPGLGALAGIQARGSTVCAKVAGGQQWPGCGTWMSRALAGRTLTSLGGKGGEKAGGGPFCRRECWETGQ